MAITAALWYLQASLHTSWGRWKNAPGVPTIKVWGDLFLLIILVGIVYNITWNIVGVTVYAGAQGGTAAVTHKLGIRMGSNGAPYMIFIGGSKFT